MAVEAAAVPATGLQEGLLTAVQSPALPSGTGDRATKETTGKDILTRGPATAAQSEKGKTHHTHKGNPASLL